MSFTPCTIHAIQHPERTISVTGQLAQSLRLIGMKSVNIQFGSKSVNAALRLVKKKGSHLYLPFTIISELKLPQTGNCSVSIGSQGELRIGPLVGILASAGGSADNPFGPMTGFMRQIVKSGTGITIPFVFSSRSVNWKEKTIGGYFLQTNGGWVRKNVPFPDVIYNRLPTRAAEKGAENLGLKKRFVEQGIPLFNWSFFDKWDIYTLLKDDEANQFVPVSYINPTPEQLKTMLEKYPFIYLKPTGGSLGIGIYRLTYTPKRGYSARYRKNGRNVLIHFDTFDELMNMLGMNRGRLRKYVAQQGIRLIEIDECPIDFRFHMTKDGSNRWVVAAIGAKKAGKGSVTTHVRSGGQLLTVKQVMPQVFGTNGEQVLQKAEKTAIQLAEAIERNHNHRLGELGFDIGIDKSEHVWMFEANAKPGRSIFKHPSLKSANYASLRNIFDYCCYILSNSESTSATS